MILPGDEHLRALGPQAFANEVQLQRFMENHVIPNSGLQLVSSSERGGQRLGNIDTTAVDRDGTPVIFEYKRDIIGFAAMSQLARYRDWLLIHRDLFEKAVSNKSPDLPVTWDEIRLVSVGYRYRLGTAAVLCDEAEVLLLRYGYRPDNTVFIQQVERGDVGEEPPPGFSKDAYLDPQLEKTTSAAQEAFQQLRRRLGQFGLEEKIHGKKVTYGSRPRSVEVTFTDVAVRCVFKGGDEIDDPEGRARRLSNKKGRGRWRCGMVSTADVDYVSALLTKVIPPGESSD
jgi:hypothetical protein